MWRDGFAFSWSCRRSAVLTAAIGPRRVAGW